MTKEEAIEAMNAGKKVTHRHFCKSEWMTIRNGLIEFEDGVRCSMGEFWHFRKEECWQDGYSIWQGGAA